MTLFDIFKLKKTTDNSDDLKIFKEMFIKINEAVSAKDFDSLENLCTDDCYKDLMNSQADNIRNDVTNVISDITISHSYLIHQYEDPELKQFFSTVSFQSKMKDYYKSDSTNEVLSGDNELHYSEDIWTFTRGFYNDVWYLSKTEAVTA